MERYDLPDGWEWRELAQVVEIGSEQVNPFRFPDDLFNYLALENIEQGSGRVIDFTPTPGKNIKSNKFKFTSKHVLYGKLRPYLRKAFAPDFEGVSATDLLPLLPDENNLDRKFLVWWLLSPQVIEYVVGKQAGVKMPRLRSNDLAQMPIPVPVLTEQQRIVAKIESLFEQSRTARTALTRIPVLMSQFRRAVLASATSGRLTEDWREERNLSIDDWDTKTGNEIFPFITSGSRWWAKYYSDSGSIFVRVGNLDHGTIELDLSNIQYVTPPDDAEGKRTRVQVGDILISITADVGMVGYVRKDIGDAYINQHICLARQNGECIGEYLAYYLASPVGGLEQLTKAQRGATKAGLTLGDIRELHFQVPTLEEQAEIVRRVERLFAQADIIEEAASVSLRRAEQVDQSILARAFRGELG